MIYVVTGTPRSGTSMMMRCLKFAGIEPVVDAGREMVMSRRNAGDYPANPHGFFESDERDYLRVGWLSRMPENRAIKLPIPSLAVIPARPCTVIWMHRDPDEVMASMKRAFPEEDFAKRFPRWPVSLYEQEAVSRGILDDRKSITVIDVNYADAVKDPASALAFLPSGIGAVDPSLYRNRAA